jgi:hypothetical protein
MRHDDQQVVLAAFTFITWALLGQLFLYRFQHCLPVFALLFYLSNPRIIIGNAEFDGWVLAAEIMHF